MTDIILTKQNINQMEIFRTNGYHSESILYKYNDSTLLKIYSPYIDLKIKEEETNRLLKLPIIDHIILPKQKVYVNNKFAGFSMPFVKNSRILRELLDDESIDFKMRIEMGRQLSSALKLFHSHNLVYGDIHFDNIISTNTAAYLIDSDTSGLSNKSDRSRPLYYLKLNDTTLPIKKETMTTDNVKLTLCILSFMYGANIETYILKDKPRECRLDVVAKLAQNLHLPMEMKYNLLHMFHNPLENADYFEKYSEDLEKNKMLNLIYNDSLKLKKLMKK